MRVNQGMVSTRSVCVRRNCFRHVGESSLEQSLNSGSVLQVVGRKVLGLRTRLGLTLLASRMLHRKTEMLPGRSLEKSWRRWTAARFGVSVWGRAKRRASPRAGPWRSGSRVVRRFARAQGSWRGQNSVLCASSARIGATTGRWSGRSVVLVGHVSASNTREVDASPAACDRESPATLPVRALARSARSNMQ